MICVQIERDVTSRGSDRKDQAAGSVEDQPQGSMRDDDWMQTEKANVVVADH